MSTPLTLLETADLLGRYRYLELVGFSVLGRRVVAADSGAVADFLSGASRAHGYRALLIESRLPVSAGLPGVAASTRAPSPHTDALFAELVARPDEGLLAGLSELYRQMIAAYETHTLRCSPYADRGIERMLLRLIDDLRARSKEARVLLGAAVDVVHGLLENDIDEPFGPIRQGM